MWNDTVYDPGEVCAVAYKNGVEAERKTLCTSGAPYRIELSEYVKTISADGESLNYVTAKIVDKNGNPQHFKGFNNNSNLHTNNPYITCRVHAGS